MKVTIINGEEHRWDVGNRVWVRVANYDRGYTSGDYVDGPHNAELRADLERDGYDY